MPESVEVFVVDDDGGTTTIGELNGKPIVGLPFVHCEPCIMTFKKLYSIKKRLDENFWNELIWL